MAHLHRDFFSKRFLVALCVLGAMALSLAINLSHIQRDLPFDIQPDEDTFSGAALLIVSTGSLNPKWFGHPGSTLIYPLAFIYHLYGVIEHQQPLFHATDFFAKNFATIRSDIFLLGRFFVSIYAMLSVPFIYLIGRRAFNVKTGLLAAWLGALAIGDYGQILRTDTVGVFFSLVALYVMMLTVERPTVKNYVMSGVALGLAIATRFLLAGFAPLLIFIHLLADRSAVPKPWRRVALAILAIGVTFIATTPFLFLDRSAALSSLRVEMRSYHPGADGLSFWQNIWWYVTVGLPTSLGWTTLVLAFFGFVSIGFKSRTAQRSVFLLVIGIPLYLITVSIPSLHWLRWVLQLLPIILLFAVEGIHWLVLFLNPKSRWLRALLTLSLVALMVVPLCDFLWRRTMITNRVSTRTQAREWVLSNIPRGSGIVYTFYAPSLSGFDFHTQLMPVIDVERLDQYMADPGLRYMIMSETEIAAYQAQPTVYVEQVAAIRRLHEHTRLLQQFKNEQPCPLPIVDHLVECNSPVLSVYEINS